jgi:hypothetical protein
MNSLTVVGAGASIDDVILQANNKIEAVRSEVMQQVHNEAKRAMIVAVAGGFVAGLLGAYIAKKIF